MNEIFKSVITIIVIIILVIIGGYFIFQNQKTPDFCNKLTEEGKCLD